MRPDRRSIWMVNALMSKCYPSNHNWRERIFPLNDHTTQKKNKFVGHASGDRGFGFFLFFFVPCIHSRLGAWKKNLYHNEKEVKATCEYKK